jgi:uncharacterized Zn finger protein
MSDWHGWSQFPKSKPLATKGGIRSQSKKFGETWWAKRWIDVLESFDLGTRLQRGRSYARSGQVLSITVTSGAVEAKVQGSRPSPYEITMQVKPLSKADWSKLAAVVSSQAIFGAKLLGGKMPLDIETAFKDAGLSLFPQKVNDLKTECSCPDWSNPCKHIAAVYYLLGEEFDRDPFLIFQLRGMNREEFLKLLGQTVPAADATAKEEVSPEPLPDSAALFWNGGPLPEDLIGSVSATAVGAALPRRLGKFPFWRGRDSLADQLESVYREAAAKAAQTLTGL